MSQTSNAPIRLSTQPKPEIWARVDARQRGGDGDIGPTTRVAGLTLVARQLRMSARQGWTGAVVVCSADQRAAIERAVEKQKPPKGFAVELAAEPTSDARTYVELKACALYAADALAEAARSGEAPEPIVEIATRADLKTAERTLVRSIRKSIDADGIVSYYVFRPISRVMTRVLINTPVTPNMVTLAALAFGIAAAICVAFGGYWPAAVAGMLYWTGAVVDCVDGELARLRVQGSKLGEWLDTLADDVSTYGLLAGLGIGLVLDGYDPIWNVVGIGGALLGSLLQAKLISDLHYWGMTIDSAQYPWFFGTPSEGEAAERGFIGYIVYGLGFIFRRDAFVTMVAAVLILGWRIPAICGLAGGVVILFSIFVIHTAVIAKRGGRDDIGGPGPWSISYFGIKDLFTIVNLMGGVGGIYFAFEGNLEYAGFAIFAGYLFGDALDGPVARMTNTSNKFGSEFDAAADHIGQAIAPAVIVYVAFLQGGYQWLGLAMMATLITSASIRQARFNVARFDYPLTYCGLPRTISGLVAISLPNSTLFFKYSVLGYEGAAAILVLVAILNLCPIPYMTHKGKRKMQTYVKIFVFIFLLVPVPMAIFAREFVYDFVFFITFGYALTAWIPIQPDERREFWAEYKRWSHDVATLR